MTAMSDERGVARFPTLPSAPRWCTSSSPASSRPTAADAAARREQPERRAEDRRLPGTGGRPGHDIDRRPPRQLDETTLEQSEIDALPDDPDELEDYLTQLAGAPWRHLPGQRLPRRAPPVPRRDPADPPAHELVRRRQPRRRPDANRDHHQAEHARLERQRQHAVSATTR